MRTGTLLVLEGAEGVGKTTQLRRLVDAMSRAGVPCEAFREPGGTPLGDEIRRLLLDPAGDVAPGAEAFLFMASRAQLVARRIRPALDAGRVVLLDRFFLATYAYQVAGRGLPEQSIREANAFATAGLVPDLTILLTLPVAEGLARADRRGARDRMEHAADDFHRRVAAAYASFTEPDWQAQHPEVGRIVPVDASGDEAQVFARIRAVLADSWPETFASLGRS